MKRRLYHHAYEGFWHWRDDLTFDVGKKEDEKVLKWGRIEERRKWGEGKKEKEERNEIRNQEQGTKKVKKNEQEEKK